MRSCVKRPKRKSAYKLMPNENGNEKDWVVAEDDCMKGGAAISSVSNIFQRSLEKGELLGNGVSGSSSAGTHRELLSSASVVLRATEGLAHAKHFRTEISIEGDELDIVPKASLRNSVSVFTENKLNRSGGYQT